MTDPPYNFSRSSFLIFRPFMSLETCRICNKTCLPTKRFVLYTQLGDNTPLSIAFSKYCGITIRRDLQNFTRYCCKSCKEKLDTISKKVNQIREDYNHSLEDQCKKKRIFHASPCKSPARSSPPKKVQRSGSTSVRKPSSGTKLISTPVKNSSAGKKLFSSPVKDDQKSGSCVITSSGCNVESLPETPVCDTWSQQSCQLLFYMGQSIVPVTPALQWLKLCNAIATNSPGEIVDAVLEHGSLREVVIQKVFPQIEISSSPGQILICKVVNNVEQECQKLCAISGHKSILRQTDNESLLKFKFAEFVEGEVKTKAPTLYKLMFGIVNSKGSYRNVSKTAESKITSVGMALGILLKTRNKNMCAVQNIVSPLLMNGNAPKRIFDRLNHLEVCLSHKSSISLLNSLGQNHQVNIAAWMRKDSIPIKLLGDNIDGRIVVRDQTTENQNKDYHWFLCMAAKERINFSHLNHDKPTADLETLPLTTFLLSERELNDLKNQMAILLLRSAGSYIEFIKPYMKYVPNHVTHQYSTEMSRKSDVINLGLVFANESSSEGMIEIMEYLHKFTNNDEQTVFGGDQLTCERATGVQRLRQTAPTHDTRLAGILPTAEDFHAEMTYLIVVFNFLWNNKSAKDIGSLYQLRSSISRTNVSGDVKHEMNATKDFLTDVTDAHVIAVACQIFGLKTIHSQPTKNCPPPESATTLEKKDWLFTVARKVIDEYVLGELKDVSKSVTNEGKGQTIRTEQMKPSSLASKTQSPASAGDANSGLFLPWLHKSTDTKEYSLNKPDKDFVYNYACSTLSLGLLHRQFHDAIKEGDGDRVEVFWKILLLIFKVKLKKSGSRTKYAFEAFRYLALVKALLTPRMAHKLKWGRFVNSTGGAGKNIPCDLRVEHEVRSVKKSFEGMGSNLNPASASRVVNAHYNMTALISSLDDECNVNQQTTSHTSMEREKDVISMVNDLMRADVFKFTGGRAHSSFPEHHRSILHNLSMESLFKWLKSLAKKFSKGYQVVDDTEKSDSSDEEE